jgi:hypothetical protein
MAYLQLPSSHYASGWGEAGEIRDFATVTNLGVNTSMRLTRRSSKTCFLSWFGASTIHFQVRD